MYKIRDWCLLIVIFISANLFVVNIPPFFQGEADVAYRGKLLDKIASSEPDMILIGNSILGHGVDEKRLSELTENKILKMERQGTGSTVWYLLLKNIIGNAQPKPSKVAVIFRETELTEPTFRVEGRYQKQIAALADQDEPLVAQLSYNQSHSLGMSLALQLIPLTRIRSEAKSFFEGSLKELTAYLTDSSARALNKDISRHFAPKKLNQAMFTQAQQKVEDADDDSLYSFESNVEASYLPAMIALAKNTGYELIFVRAKKRSHVGKENELALEGERSRYFVDLENYLKTSNVRYLDFSGSKEITLEMYADGDHLNTKGKSVFTDLLAEALIRQAA